MIAAGFLFLLLSTVAAAIAYLTLFVVGRFGLVTATTRWDVILVSTPLFCNLFSIVRFLVQPLVATRIQYYVESSFAGQFALLGSILAFGTIFASAGSSKISRAAVKIFAGSAIALLLFEISVAHSFPDDFTVIAWIVINSVAAFAAIFFNRLRTEAFSPGAKTSAYLAFHSLCLPSRYSPTCPIRTLRLSGVAENP